MTTLYSAETDFGDLEKPTWDDDIDIDDIEPSKSESSRDELKKVKKKEKKKKKKQEDHWEEDGVDVDAMDANAQEGGWEVAENGEWDGTEEMRKRKVDEYMDEVVNRLGFNDIVRLSLVFHRKFSHYRLQTAHMPTRFHYTQTTAEDYGLKPAEILLADDTELNEYVGLKRLAPYRHSGKSGKGKPWDAKRNERLKEFREKLRLRVGNGEGDWSVGGVSNRRRAGEDGGEKKKRLGKKERAKMKTSVDEDVTEGSKKRKSDSPAPEEARKKKRRRHHKKAAAN